MMKRGVVTSWCVCFLLLLLITSSACIAPQGSSGSPWSPRSDDQTGSEPPVAAATATADVTAPLYITIETPYGSTQAPTASPTATTVPPEEEWVEIYRSTQAYGYNATAFSFDLENPPMVINFVVVPVNTTFTKVIDSPYGSKEEITITYDYYSPYAWFEVTVRNKDTGAVILQDGFGNSYGRLYPSELNRTFKILSRQNLLVELRGNQITATVDVHVKKEGNIAPSL